MKKYPIKQRNRIVSPVRVIYSSQVKSDLVLRPAQRHHDKVRSRIVDGVSSSTGLFDEAFGDVPDIFNPDIDKFELANRLLVDGMSKKANEVASSGVEDKK